MRFFLSTVHVATVAYINHDYKAMRIVDRIDDPIVTNTNAPKVSAGQLQTARWPGCLYKRIDRCSDALIVAIRQMGKCSACPSFNLKCVQLLGLAPCCSLTLNFRQCLIPG